MKHVMTYPFDPSWHLLLFFSKVDSRFLHFVLLAAPFHQWFFYWTLHTRPRDFPRHWLHSLASQFSRWRLSMFRLTHLYFWLSVLFLLLVNLLQILFLLHVSPSPRVSWIRRRSFSPLVCFVRWCFCVDWSDWPVRARWPTTHALNVSFQFMS